MHHSLQKADRERLAAINRYLAEHNASPKSFVWTALAASILAKLDRLSVTSVGVGALDLIPADTPIKPTPSEPSQRKHCST